MSVIALMHLHRGRLLERRWMKPDSQGVRHGSAFHAEELAFATRCELLPRTCRGIRAKLVEGKHLAKDDIITWQRILNQKGWAVANWPVEWGGTGWTPVQQYIFQEELQLTPAPQPLGFGVTMVGPVMIAFGSRGAEKALSAAHRQSRRLVVPGLFRARRRLRPRLAAGPRPSATATITSSTGRRPGRPWRSTPTGSSAWCAPTRRPKSRRASRSC